VNPPSRAVLPVLGLFGVAVSLGAGHVCARLAFTNGVNILTAATVRSLLATALLLVLLRLRGTALLPLPREFKATLALGLLIAVQTLTIQVAVSLLPVTIALLVFTVPFFDRTRRALLGDARFPGVPPRRSRPHSRARPSWCQPGAGGSAMSPPRSGIARVLGGARAHAASRAWPERAAVHRFSCSRPSR
jgi:hypothetical protein